MYMIMTIKKSVTFCMISIIIICQLLSVIEITSAAADPTDDLSTIEPASTGCPAPDLRFTRPRVTDTTTEPPYAEFGTTQIYLPEDFTTYDIEIVEKSDIDLTGINNNHDDTIINPYRIESDVTENAQLHENENEHEHDQNQRASENRNRRNKKRRFTGGRRRRIENENGSSGGRSGRNRYKRHTIHNNNKNDNYNIMMIGSNKNLSSSSSSLPEPPSSLTNKKNHNDNVYYVEIADLINSGFFDKLKNDKNKNKKKSHHNKKSKHHTKNKNYKKNSLLNSNDNVNNDTITKQNNDENIRTSDDNRKINHNNNNNNSSNNNNNNDASDDNVKNNLNNVQNELMINMTNDNSNNNNATDDDNNNNNNDHLQRVKRKSGKTTGALSRPKGGGGDSGSKSTSRKDKGNIDEDGGYSPTHTDEESSEEDEKSSESSEHSQFTEVSEIRFPGEVGPLGDRRLCKIRCVKGKWVGPLCATNEEDDHGNVKFQPLYKSCHVNRIPPHLLLSYRNISVNVGWDLPHGHSLQARCKDLGLYKLLGESRVLCSNGLWAPRMPSCVPTTLLTNFSDDSPPSIRIKIGTGSGAFEPSGVLAVLPGSTIHLDCMYPRRRGTPEWTWTGWFKQYYTGWSTIPEEKATKYRLTIKDIQNQDSGTYTCASPRGLTNSISIIVATSQCPQLPEPTSPLSLRLEGNKLGQRALYRCPLGFTTEGITNSTCLASGNWSSPPPTCHPVQCPPLFLEDPHLSLTELNTSAWGRAVFKCSWGFRLSGPPGLECEPTGVWSGPVPRCRAIQCPQPLVPINGRIDGTSGSSSHRRYAVGALVTFSCTEGHLLVGEASIVCTETGFWSHPPPFCKSQCPYPGDPPNGLIAPLKFHYDPGDLLSVQCRPGFVEFSVNGPPERPRCLPDGNWSGPVPQCRSYEEV